jgi:hypothetical protein
MRECSLTALLAVASASSAFAQDAILTDPMRPSHQAEPTAQGAAPPPSGSGVRVILTSPGRKLAVVDGQIVPLGAREDLPLHPGIRKQPASSRKEAPQ